MTDWDVGAAFEVVQQHRQKGGLLGALHGLLDAFGYVDPRAIPMVADVFNLTRAEVTGVVSFYKDFRTTPPGRHVLKLCRAEACQAVGCETVAQELETRLGVGADATTADDAVTVETVYCLGNCALGPAALVDGKLYGRVDAPSLLARLGR